MITLQSRRALIVRVLDTPEQWREGFQHATPDEIAATLLVFAYPQKTDHAYHMRNVVAPLDIAFLDSDSTILDIQRMEPNQVGYHCQKPHQMAVEARAGYFSENGYKVGDAFDLPAA